LQSNALEWLQTLPTGTGRVMPPESTWNNRWRRWRQEKKHPVPLSWWVKKDDVLRHSYGTYRAAILRNSHALAEEMGTSVQMIRSHYDAVVSPSVAKPWWELYPKRPKNVVSIATAAWFTIDHI
jgi:hypothetical protein